MFADYDIDLNSILANCDYLITDYSGVAFDFLYLKNQLFYMYQIMRNSYTKMVLI